MKKYNQLRILNRTRSNNSTKNKKETGDSGNVSHFGMINIHSKLSGHYNHTRTKIHDHPHTRTKIHDHPHSRTKIHDHPNTHHSSNDEPLWGYLNLKNEGQDKNGIILYVNNTNHQVVVGEENREVYYEVKDVTLPLDYKTNIVIQVACNFDSVPKKVEYPRNRKWSRNQTKYED